MIGQLAQVILPVFLVIGAGYLAARLKFFTTAAVDGLMDFAIKFAVPALLFLNIMRLDLAAYFDWRLLVTFFAGAFAAFTLGIIGARILFKRRPGDSVAIGFGAMFSNSLLLGLPIMERAYGADALAGNFAILSIHAPIIYLVGITVMEAARSDGRGVFGTSRVIAKAMFRNTLMIGLALGFIVNLGQIPMPASAISAIELIARAALPAALFGLGGMLTRYALRASLGEAGMIAVLSLIIHPAITYFLATQVFELSTEFTRSAVVTASMAPGINAYVFAKMYNRAVGAASSAVLLATTGSILSISVWLYILG